MPLPPALDALHDRLQRAGDVVVAFGDTFEVRLPLLTRVRVTYIRGQLRCEPYFGFLPRTRATYATLGVLTALGISGFLAHGVTPLACVYAVCAFAGGIHEVLRHVVVEGGLTRIRLTWATLHPNSEGMVATGPGTRTAALSAPAPAWDESEGGRPEPAGVASA